MEPRAARAAWTVFVIGLLIYLAYVARHTLLIFSLSMFFAYMLSPVVNFIDRIRPPRLSRNFTLAIVYLLFIALLVGIAFAIGSTIAEQAAALASRLPDLVKTTDPLEFLPLPGWLDPMRARITEALRGQVENLDKEAFPLIKSALTQVLSKAGSVLEFILVPILGFFMLKDGAAIREAMIGWTTRGRTSVLLEEILADVHVLLGHYIRALIILSAATFVVFGVFLQIVGAQYALLLAGVAAMLEFIPVVGPLSAGVIIVIVQSVTAAGTPGANSHAAAIIVFLILYRLFQDYVLSPYLMGTGVELHPLLVLFGVLAGEQVAGIPGMFFSVPVLAAARIIYKRARASRLGVTAAARDQLVSET
ncbi:MAG: AI-2E family transporter [Acidobacteria bacterium]|nr:AI-2E family transporter [Acidobacteriota bacterium]